MQRAAYTVSSRCFFIAGKNKSVVILFNKTLLRVDVPEDQIAVVCQVVGGEVLKALFYKSNFTFIKKS